MPRGAGVPDQLRGWLALQHLTSSVKVVGFASEQAVAAGYLAGKLAGGYVQAGPEAQLIKKDGHALIDAERSGRSPRLPDRAIAPASAPVHSSSRARRRELAARHDRRLAPELAWSAASSAAG
jgi:hypothetical protein